MKSVWSALYDSGELSRLWLLVMSRPSTLPGPQVLAAPHTTTGSWEGQDPYARLSVASMGDGHDGLVSACWRLDDPVCAATTGTLAKDERVCVIKLLVATRHPDVSPRTRYPRHL